MPLTTVVAVDPGYRNLAVATLKIQQGKVISLDARHHDLGPISGAIALAKQFSAHLHRTQPFKNADLIIIENQQMGRAHSVPTNVGMQYMLLQAAHLQAPNAGLRLMPSKSKFKLLQPQFPFLKPVPRKRQALKQLSIRLARELISKHRPGRDQNAIFQPAKPRNWEHLADALAMAFAATSWQLTASSASPTAPRTASSAACEAKI